MDLGLEGRRCVVAGGSRGIGRAIALGLAAEGADVAICARTAEPLRRTDADLRAHGCRVHAALCDVANPGSLAQFLEGARDALGGVDVLVHNASALAFGPDLASWDASLQVDLMSAVRACDQVLPWMEQAGGGSILLLSSISGLEISPNPDFAYTSIKSALIAYARKLALLQAYRRVRVNVLAPGSIDFPGGVWAQVWERHPERYEAVRASIPWGRLGTAQEVADVAVFLVSPRAGWMTGACVVVDGGQHRGIR